jgi:uncharacterized protein
MAFDETTPGAREGIAVPEAGARVQDAAAARTVFAQVMFLVAVSVAFTAVGAWIGRDLSGGWAIAFFIAAFIAILSLNWVRGTSGLAMGVLFGAGLLLGLGLGPGLAAYANAEGGPAILAQAAGATALFIGGFGAYGYATRRDLSSWARYLFWALLGLIAFGLITLFVAIPNGNIVYALLGLVIFAGFTMFDFNRLRRARPEDSVWIAASIYLDIVNVFLFMLQILGGGRD